MKLLRLTILFCLQFSLLFSGVPRGLPLIRNYTFEDYAAHAQNWCITQDSNGVMYFGNNEGLLTFNGTKWDIRNLDNFSILRSLLLYSNRLWVGGQDEFGVLGSDFGIGKTYKALSDSVINTNKGFSDVWRIYHSGNQVVFQTYKCLFLVDSAQKIRVIDAPSEFHFANMLHNQLYVIDKENGLMTLHQNKLVNVAGGAYFKGKRIYAFLPTNHNKAYAVTREEGLVPMDFSSPTQFVIGETDEAIQNLNKMLLEKSTYCAKRIDQNLWIFGFIDGGCMIANESGEVIHTLNTVNGICNNTVNDIFQDRNGDIWLATDNGISFIEWSNNISSLNFEGKDGQVNAVLNFKNDLFAATTQGVFVLEGNRYTRLKGLKNQVFGLKVIHGKLYCAGESGVYEIAGKQLIKISDDYSFALQDWNQEQNSKIIVGKMDGLSMYDPNRNTYEKLLPVNLATEVRKLLVDHKNNLWVGTTYQGVYRINYTNKSYEVLHYDSTKGFLDQTYNVPFSYHGMVLFGTFKGLYFFDETKDRIVPYPGFGQKYADGSRQVFQLSGDNYGNTFIFEANQLQAEYTVFDSNKKERVDIKRLREKKLFDCVLNDTSGITFFAGSDGIYAYDVAGKKGTFNNYGALITLMTAGKDTVFRYGQTGLAADLAYRKNNVSFEFACPFYQSTASNRFSYFLEGFDEEWSTWTSESKVVYTNLPEGAYTMHLKVNNIYGLLGNPTKVVFTVLPPWYRTFWAYGIYTIMGAGLIYLIIRLSVYRLQMANLKLEGLVRERTAEVVAEKEEVEKQKKLVEHKNKDITDSINYAKKIQDAILPPQEDISKIFPDSFVLFRPRDIVSGDFYWFNRGVHENNRFVFVAVADCTGHGVPGAFMSMIGNTLLNEIVDNNLVENPGEILDALHVNIRSSLRQGTDSSQTNDGMDIALVRFDTETREIIYSGANRPLVVFSGGTLTEIKPDKISIGGYQSEEKRKFTSHHLQLKPGDSFYLFSDGFADQFGGSSGKKYMVKHLHQTLSKINAMSMKNQALELMKSFENWKGTEEQVDDVLVMGIRV